MKLDNWDEYTGDYPDKEKTMTQKQLKDPKTCHHGNTHRVTGTRDLWHCLQCNGMLKDNVELIDPASYTEEGPAPEPGRGGIVARFRKGNTKY